MLLQNNTNLTLLGFDYGPKKIGVSIGNTISGTASPLKILHGRSKIEGFNAVKSEILHWDPGLVVVGFPSHRDGSLHPFANNCKKFARKISTVTGKKVRLVDESYTSVLSKGRGHDDARAAALILQVVLDELFSANK